MSMIVNIYFFVSCGQQSDAGGGFGYILWFLSMIVIIYFLFQVGSSQMQEVARSLRLHTLVPVYDSYHLLLFFRWAAVRCRR